jgi:hypothetical protein
MILRNKCVRSAHPIKVHDQLRNWCPNVAGNSGEEVSERRPQLLTFSPPPYCTWPNGNIYFFCFLVYNYLSKLSLASTTASGPTSSSLSSRHPWQERNYESTCQIDTSSLPAQCTSQVEAQARPANRFDHSSFPIRSWGIPVPTLETREVSIIGHFYM